MSTEIERKFLVTTDEWRAVPGLRIRQGYLNRDKDRTVRVRTAGDRAWLTIKGRVTGISRAEFEYEIPLADADQLMSLCEGPLIDKIRRTLDYQGTTWEVDEFSGDNAGLIIAEVELAREDQPFARPAWVGEEVTADPRYFNSNLSSRPYRTWGGG
jgi:adenylate cyclase